MNMHSPSIPEPGCFLATHYCWFSSLLMHLAHNQLMAQVLGLLAAMWETHMVIPGFWF